MTAPPGYERLPGGVLARSEERAWIEALGLGAVDEAFALPGERRGEVKSLVRLEAPDGRRVFVKRYAYRRPEAWLRCAFKWNFPVWSGPRELHNLLALADAGLRVPCPLAAGEEDRGARRRSFVALAELPGRPLAALTPPAERETRRALLFAVARTVRALHEAGFWHKDLYLDNVFWEPGLGPGLIDCERVERRADGPPLRWRIKDYAALDYSATWPSQSERLRFLCECLGLARPTPEARRLARLVRRKARRMARRGRKGA